MFITARIRRMAKVLFSHACSVHRGERCLSPVTDLLKSPILGPVGDTLCLGWGIPQPRTTDTPLAKTGQYPQARTTGTPSPSQTHRTRTVVRRRWYASCVHAGGLSCFDCFEILPVL